MATADLNHDGHPDIVVANRGDDTVSVLLSHADGAGYNAAATYPVGDEPVAVAIPSRGPGTVPDIAVANQGDDTAIRAAGQRRRHLQAARASPSRGGRGPVSLDIGDLPRPDDPIDGNGDLVLATPGSHDVTLAFLAASGGLDATYSVAVPGSTPVGALVTKPSIPFSRRAMGS